MNKSKILNAIKFFLFNGLFIWCLIEALNGNNGAKNLLVFYVWLSAICYWIAIGSKKTAEIKQNTVNKILIKFGLIINIASIIALIWNGWIFTSIAMLLIILGKLVIFVIEEKK